ncbi:MAG: sigma-54-dependent Fis family transcriptional regulator [Candidatus Paracaedimonas acanthamoebae]|uniref:Sigma-54-dependent Fis family transcriptional regulator n=1 Tax=Candidatus Paracaedimonas acanthamoebae TaxID=244581 RepID=A0A8J7PZW1_9PROT|nr:sigma-54-dependent Fis family transcriptional regulator [Candidatus Paracaedimonas acanthamoebae]
MARDILIVDDEADIGRLMTEILEDEGYQCRHAIDGTKALEEIHMRRPSLVILDIWLGDSRFDGIKLLELIRKDHIDLPVIMMSGHGTIETAVTAIKNGAYDFIEKPFKANRLLLVIERAIEAAKLKRENKELRSKTSILTQLIGASPSTNQIRQQIERVASTSSRVLISGASGVGKEVVARLIHNKSRREKGPFIVLNCATLNPERFEQELFGQENEQGIKIGLLEQAHQGTLFLDEVSDMPLETQGKIVRSLQEQNFLRVGGTKKVQVDVRVLASSSQDIKLEVMEGKFREDLYYRLNVVPLRVPCLKERRDDIPQLVEEFTQRIASSQGLPLRIFTKETLLILQSYDWPGNIRQLKNVIEWILIMAMEKEDHYITPDFLPAEICGETPSLLRNEESSKLMSLPLREAREHFEKDYLLAQVARFSGNISQTAHFVGMERSALHRKLKTLQIERNNR